MSDKIEKPHKAPQEKLTEAVKNLLNVKQLTPKIAGDVLALHVKDKKAAGKVIDGHEDLLNAKITKSAQARERVLEQVRAESPDYHQAA